MNDTTKSPDTLQEFANQKFIENYVKYEKFYLAKFNNNETQQLLDQIKEKELEIKRLTKLLEAKQQPKPQPEKFEPLKEEFVDETVTDFLFKEYVEPNKKPK
jgi:hypothetical protein